MAYLAGATVRRKKDLHLGLNTEVEDGEIDGGAQVVDVRQEDILPAFVNLRTVFENFFSGVTDDN